MQSQPDGGRADRRILPSVAECETPHPVPSFISADVVGRSLSHYEINPLYRYLCQTFGEEETLRLFQLYRIGTSSKWGGATIFWQTDRQGQVRTGKIMQYDPATGHRIKEPRAYVSWVHSELRLPDFHLRQCLFGEHLLNRSTSAPVMLVESEKTAVVMCHFIPDYIWLATGGKNGSFNREAMSVLRDREVTLIPRSGGNGAMAGEIRPADRHLQTGGCIRYAGTPGHRRTAQPRSGHSGLLSDRPDTTPDTPADDTAQSHTATAHRRIGSGTGRVTRGWFREFAGKVHNTIWTFCLPGKKVPSGFGRLRPVVSKLKQEPFIKRTSIMNTDRKQAMHVEAGKSFGTAEANENERRWNDDKIGRKNQDPTNHYDKSRMGLNFEIGSDGKSIR